MDRTEPTNIIESKITAFLTVFATLICYICYYEQWATIPPPCNGGL